jgi:hypothetical protein
MSEAGQKHKTYSCFIQRVTEISTLILTGNSIYHFAEKRCLIPKKNCRDFSYIIPRVVQIMSRIALKCHMIYIDKSQLRIV